MENKLSNLKLDFKRWIALLSTVKVNLESDFFVCVKAFCLDLKFYLETICVKVFILAADNHSAHTGIMFDHVY